MSWSVCPCFSSVKPQILNILVIVIQSFFIWFGPAEFGFEILSRPLLFLHVSLLSSTYSYAWQYVYYQAGLGFYLSFAQDNFLVDAL